jgi:hypothetical protein
VRGVTNVVCALVEHSNLHKVENISMKAPLFTVVTNVKSNLYM